MMSLKQSKNKIFLLKIVRIALLVGATVVLFPAIALAAPPSPLDPASPGARSIATLHNVVFVIATIVFAVVAGLLIYSLIRFRRRSADEPEPDQSLHGNATLETIWTLIPVGILVVLLVLTFQTFRDTDPNRPTELTVRAVGKQWLWEIQYPAYDITLIGEMWVPVNTDIKVEVTSEDVIHSFWIPQMGGKTDAIPGYLQTTWFKADRLGTFRGQCAEYCGLAHYNMPIELKVVDQESFDIWLASKQERQTNLDEPAPEPKAGQESLLLTE
jgi:cytochrome c oxidase subunit 2